MTTNDAVALARLLAAAETVDRTSEHFAEVGLAEDLASDMVDLDRGSVAVQHGEELVGYGLIRRAPSAAQADRVRVEAAVHPAFRRRGIGQRLLSRLVAQSRALHERLRLDRPLNVYTSVHESNHGAAALVVRAGFTKARCFRTMRRDLTEPVAGVPVPAGLRLVTCSPDLAQALRLAFNEAFADHWNGLVHTEQSWREIHTDNRSFVADLSFALLDTQTGEVAAFMLNRHNEGDTLATGIRELWVEDLGTRRLWRRRGAAGALLAHAFTAAYLAGYRRCGLVVDADSPTGAPEVYLRAGFVVTDRWTTFTLPVTASG